MDYLDWSNYKDTIDFYYISQNKYFQFDAIKSQYDFYMLVIENLNVPYNKKYVVNYIFSQIFMESIARTQQLSKININGDEDCKEKLIYDIFFKIFDDMLYDSREFIYWHCMNKDRFSLKDIPYHDIVFEPIKIEQVCYFNYKFDSLDRNDITVIKVFLSYMQGNYCKSIEPNLWKFKYSSVFDFFDFDIKKYIDEFERKSRIKPLNKQNYNGIKISDLKQIRDALFTRYQAICCIEECRIEVERILKGISVGVIDKKKYKSDKIYISLKERIAHVLDFISKLYNENSCPLSVRFEYYMSRVSDIQRPIGTDKNYEKERMKKGNPITVKQYSDYSLNNEFGIKTKIKPSDYRDKINELISNKAQREQFMEFFSDENELQTNKKKLVSDLNELWVEKNYLIILDSMILSKVLSVPFGFVNDIVSDSQVNSDDAKDKNDSRTKKEIKDRLKRFYIDWISIADDIHSRSYN
ncbi:hypothetical protein QIW49_01630 [Francisellaceae bacterium CB300]